MKEDTRVVYGAGCVWWDSIHNAGSNGGLPSCPYCGSMLFEMESEKKWLGLAQKYEKAGHSGYVDFIKWLKGKCYPNYDAARSAYKKVQHNVT